MNKALRSLILLGLLVLWSSTLIYAADEKKAPQPQPQKSLEEERLSILKEDIQKALDEYKKLKAEVEKSQKILDEKNKEKVTNVAKMYEAMAPEEAAQKIDKLDEQNAILILSALKPKAAGRILAQMENAKAASLSKKMLTKSSIPQEKTSQ